MADLSAERTRILDAKIHAERDLAQTKAAAAAQRMESGLRIGQDVFSAASPIVGVLFPAIMPILGLAGQGLAGLAAAYAGGKKIA